MLDFPFFFKDVFTDNVVYPLSLPLTTLTDSGLVCVWEEGGKINELNGYSIIVADEVGLPLSPTFIKYKHIKDDIFLKEHTELQHPRCHALIPLSKKHLITMCYHHNQKFQVVVFRVKIPRDKHGNTRVTLVNQFKNNQWKEDYPSRFQPMINAAISKCYCYQCNHVHYYMSKLLKNSINSVSKNKHFKKFNNKRNKSSKSKVFI